METTYAGTTNVPCGTMVRITHVTDNDEDAQELIGLTGTITHPFGGLMTPGVTYIAGIRVDSLQARQRGISDAVVNLVEGDEFEVIEEEELLEDEA